MLKKVEGGDEKLERVEEAKAEEDEEKEVFDLEYEQNLPEGETERRTGPLDLVLDDDLDIFVKRQRKKSEGESKRREKSLFFFFFFPSWVPLGELVSQT